MLDGKTALVTGASRGIGKAIVQELLSQGATVVGTATTEQGAQAISDYILASGGKGAGMVLNVCDNASIEKCLEEINKQYGAPLILINNAAVTRDNLLLRMKDEEWDTVYETNLRSVFRLCKACLRAMVKAREGRIVNISSVVAKTGNPGQCNYTSAKAGMIGFSKSLAREVAARGITVNVVAPGFIETDMTAALNEQQKNSIVENIPMGSMGSAADVAYAVGFLVSPRAGYVTGHTMDVNGGMFME